MNETQYENSEDLADYILSPINSILQTNLTRIEELGTGAIHCQLLEAIYPDKVPLDQVIWTPQTEEDIISNFKIFQASYEENCSSQLFLEDFIYGQWIENLSLLCDMCEHIQQIRSKQPNDQIFNEESHQIQAPTKDEKEMRKDMIAQLRSLIKEQKEEKREDLEILKADRDFYWSKMDWVSGVLDFYKGKDVESLKGIIKEILYLSYEKSVVVKRDGTIEISEKMI